MKRPRAAVRLWNKPEPFERGGQMTGLPDLFRWDCSALRPPCGEGILPATPWPQGQSQPGVILLPPRR